ncbi:MAG: AmmeMemoRadiSam system protein B [Myxococcota bacterium]
MTPPRTRPAAVAGLFYTDVPSDLRSEVDGLLQVASARGDSENSVPKALIAPHAGYRYSGAIAASAYARLRSSREAVTRVVLMGPGHRVWVDGMASVGVEAFDTPWGPVRVDQAAIAEVIDLPQVVIDDAAHGDEHSLEVHLPFLQACLSHFSIVPLVVGGADAAQVAEVLERLWGGPETLIVVSSDLSHHHDGVTARRIDAQTSAAIEALDLRGVSSAGACGAAPIRGLLLQAQRRGLVVETVDLRHSGDTAGSRDDVVGYGAYVFS